MYGQYLILEIGLYWRRYRSEYSSSQEAEQRAVTSLRRADKISREDQQIAGCHRPHSGRVPWAARHKAKDGAQHKHARGTMMEVKTMPEMSVSLLGQNIQAGKKHKRIG